MYSKFFDITRKMNLKFSLIPLLYGSLGLQLLVEDELRADDIDVLIPEIYLKEKWEALVKFMEDEGYVLIDLEEHTFIKDNIKMAFAAIEGLEEFADIDLAESSVTEKENAYFRLLNLSQYLNLYLKSSKDGYRINKNNAKDFKKIELIKKALMVI